MKLGKYETNNIYCEDSYEAVKNIPDKSVDLIVIDPPYEVATTGGGGTINSIKKNECFVASLIGSKHRGWLQFNCHKYGICSHNEKYKHLYFL